MNLKENLNSIVVDIAYKAYKNLDVLDDQVSDLNESIKYLADQLETTVNELHEKDEEFVEIITKISEYKEILYPIIKNKLEDEE